MKNTLPQQLTEQLEIPVIAAPMFLISSPKLVIESCKSGIIGSFPLLNARTGAILEDWLQQITTELEQIKSEEPSRRVAPWAVNFIVHRSNKRFEEDLELIKKYQPPIVITSLGNPKPIVKIVHDYGGLVFSDVANLAHARKAADTGVDGLILVCNGAGGHAGTTNPFAFISAVKQFWDGITILAGSITNGQDILASQALGADISYMGTRFIAASESFASDDYQQMLIDSTFEDLVYTDAFSGVNANYLIPSIQKAGLDPENLQKKEDIDFSEMDQSKPKANAWKDIWSAGQGVTTIKDVKPVADIITELKNDYHHALDALVKNK
ncbi:NAD(P)H-dependent flavin oxidoreductase [Desertibacillus haloalkaliphilus]|uniref:NAD(P)H-dependent flavin oxidoreductase n=1 Tax=Desertibacillus haloalkaliphilus TaxID=1328930 RepID=UPI001C267BDD|nr:nitronate monooxygenase [Desertibacillus haloalkaliphilus]MBU8906106.1 nitronate monooxygenase [Desertibacillus haloalkaliphilus]